MGAPRAWGSLGRGVELSPQGEEHPRDAPRLRAGGAEAGRGQSLVPGRGVVVVGWGGPAEPLPSWARSRSFPAGCT